MHHRLKMENAHESNYHKLIPQKHHTNTHNLTLYECGVEMHLINIIETIMMIMFYVLMKRNKVLT